MNNKIQIPILASDGYSKQFDKLNAAEKKLVAQHKKTSLAVADLSKKTKQLAQYDGLQKRILQSNELLGREKKALIAAQASTKKLSSEKRLAAQAYAKSSMRIVAAEKNENLSGVARRKELRSLRKEQRVAASAVKHFSSELKKSSTAQRTAAGRIQRTSEAVLSQKGKLSRLRSELKASGIDAKKLSTAQRNLAADTKKVNTQLEKERTALKKVQDIKQRRGELNDKRRDLQGKLVRQSAVAAGGIALPTKLAMDFEGVWSDVRKKVNGASPAELLGLKKWTLDNAASLGQSNAGLAEIIAQGGAAGLPLDELRRFSIEAAKSQVAFDVSAEQAGLQTQKFKNQMGLTWDRTYELTNAINYLGDNLATNASDISDATVRQSSVVSGAGFNETQAAALFAALNSVAPSPEMAATAGKNLSITLASGDANSKMQRESLETLGFDPQALAQAMQKNAVKATLEVFERIKKLPKDQQTGLQRRLFGKESLGAITPLIQNLDVFKRAMLLVGEDVATEAEAMRILGVKNAKELADAQDYKTSKEKEFAIQMEQSSKDVGYMKQQLSSLGIVFGEELLPIMSKVSRQVGDAAGALREFLEENENAAKGLATFAATMALLVPAFTAARIAALLFKSSLLTGRAGKLANVAGVGTLAAGGLAGGKKSLLKKIGGKAFKPLGLALGAGALAASVEGGNSQEIGASAGGLIGDVGGGLGGAAAGAAIGTMIFPGVGTAIGGLAGLLVGSFAGGAAGEALGDKIGSMLLQNESKIGPKEISAPLADNRQISFAPVFQITEANNAQEIAQMAMRQMKTDIYPMLQARPLDDRLNASLATSS